MSKQLRQHREDSDFSRQQDGKAWRYVHLLLLAQVLGASAPPIIISLGGLIGMQLAENKALATLPVSLFNIGLALSMWPVTMLIRRWGRQRAYMLGTLFSFSGGLIAAWGLWQSSFLIFCIGTAMAGFYAACVQNYRFAVTDYIALKKQPEAISRVMVGGIAAAVLGPQLAIVGSDLFEVAFAGSFLSQSLLAVIAFFVVSQIGRVTAGLSVQGEQASSTVQERKNEQEEIRAARPLLELLQSLKLMTTVLTAMVSYGVMAFLMTATPMAMRLSGHSVADATLGVQWHILAMYVPSLVTGKLMVRYGRLPVAMAGMFLIGVSALLYLGGESLFHYWGGFILLGVGWNFGFIGATAMLSSCHLPSERTKVQGLNDVLVFSSTAVCSLLSGYLLYSIGWSAINKMVFPLVVFVMVLLFIQMKKRAFNE